VPTLATQMLFAWFCNVQPVTCSAPVRTAGWPAGGLVGDRVPVLAGVGAGEAERLRQPVRARGQLDATVGAG